MPGNGNGPKVEINTTINSGDSLKQINSVMQSMTKAADVSANAVGTYTKRLDKLIRDLDAITRTGSNAGQTVRDLSLAGGGSSIAGRVRQSNVNSKKADMQQVSEVLVADLVNFQAGVFKRVAASTKAGLITNFARQKQELASIDAEIRRAQIEAQRARVGFASQLNGTRGNNRGTITENANSLGVQNLGTLRAEQAALDKLLAAETAYKEQARQVNKELRDQEQLTGQIQRMSNGKLAPLRAQIEMLQKQNAIERENLNIANAKARGDTTAVVKARLKQESLRMDQMALRGVKEESREYQEQIQLVRRLVAERDGIVQKNQTILKQTREQAELERSRNFAAGNGGTRAEIQQNNIQGARRVAASTESRASLLATQGSLLMNYGLLGGGVAAIAGVTNAVVDLDAKLRELQAIAGATNGEFEGLRGVILKTSEDTKFSAVELAESATLLAQVGQSVAEIEETLPVISAFAMAVGTDMKNAVDIVTTTLTVFNMNASQTQRITNVMAEALNRSKLSMDQLTLGFQYAANIAADSGVTFEELTAALAGMSQAGIRSGSMLGTGLRQIMISLASPTDELRELLGELGLSLSDVDIKSQGLTGVLKNFADAGLSAGQAMSVFETRTAAALIAATNQVGFMMQVQEGFANTQAAEIAAAAQSESFKNSTLELKNEFLSFMNDALRPILETLIGATKGFKEFGNSIGPAIPLLKAATAALITFFAATSIMGVAKLGIEFVKFSGILNGFFTTLPLLTRAFSMTILSFQGGIGVVGSLRLAMTALASAWLPLTVITGAAAALVYFYTRMNSAGKVAEDFTKNLDAQKTAFNENKAAQDKYEQILSQIDQTIARVRTRAAQLKDGSQELRIEVQNGAAAFNEYGAGIDANNLKLKDYIESLQGAKLAVAALAEEQARQAQKEAGQAAFSAQEDFKGSFNRLKAMDRLGNPLLLRDAQGTGKLSPQEIQNLTKFVDKLKELQQLDPTTMTGGDLNNFLSNVNGMMTLLNKADPVKFRGLIDNLSNARFGAATLSSSRSTLTTANDEARALELARSPAYTGFSNALLSRASPLTSFGAMTQSIARNNRGNAGEQFRQTDAALASYGRDYRSMNAAVDGARATFGYENRSLAERAAFDKVMKPVEDILVQIRENLLTTGKSQNEIAASSLELFDKVLTDAPNRDFATIRSQMQSVGFTPTGNDVTELRQWVLEEKARRNNNNNVDSLVGRASTRRVLEQGIEADYLRQNGPVAERDRIPMAQRIRDRAADYGLSPDLMRNVASYETGGRFNADATNPKSTARGLFQIMADTWNARRPGQQVSGYINDRNPNDPRLNAEQNMTFAMEEMSDRLKQMTTNLGRRPEDWEMYLAWQQGVGGATRILQNPNANLAGTVGRQEAALNGGQGLTNAQFATKVRQTYAQHAGQAGNESARSLGEAAESLAKDTRAAADKVADAARTVATTARAQATRSLRNLSENTSDSDASTAFFAVQSALEEVDIKTNQYYDQKIANLKAYKDALDKAGRLTVTEAANFEAELADLESSRENENERNREDAISTFESLYSKVPAFTGAFSKLAKDSARMIEELNTTIATSAATAAVNFQEARDRIISATDARAVAGGRMSQAEADARSALRGRDARNAQEAAAPQELTGAIARRGIITNTLNAKAGDTGLTLREVTIGRVAKEQEKLNNMSRSNTAEYAYQESLVKEMTDNLSTANEYRTSELELMIEIDALQESITQGTANVGDRLQTIIAGWAENRGTFNSMLTDVLDGVPGVLDTVSSSFSTFFSDVLSGTASVGDAFRSMASSILKSMMDIVASAAAKQLMRMLLNIGMSLLGGGNPVSTGAGGLPFISTANFTPAGMREGGFIRAATGMAVRGRDSVPILGMPGEYLLRKTAVDAIGVDNLNHINAQGNRVMAGGTAAQPVKLANSQQPAGQPLSIYVVSPDKQPPPSKDQIVVMVQEDMINRGPVYKAVKAVQAGAI